MTFSFEEVPLDVLRDKPKVKQPSPRQLRIQQETEQVQEMIRRAKSEKKAFRVKLGETKPATFRLRFTAGKKQLGRGYEGVNLVTRGGELFVGPVEPARRGGRRRKTAEESTS